MKRGVAVIAVLASLSVFAQTEKPKPPPDQKVIFTPQDIHGGKLVPGGGYINPPPKPVFNSLITVRSSFQSELQQSVEGLK